MDAFPTSARDFVGVAEFRRFRAKSLGFRISGLMVENLRVWALGVGFMA